MNKAKVTYFKKDAHGNQLWNEDKSPVKDTMILSFPIEFGFGSYNEPRKLFRSNGVDAADVISIDVV